MRTMKTTAKMETNIFEYLNKIGFDVNNPYFFEIKKEVIYANYVDKN